MALYKYQSGSTIDEVRIVTSASRGVRAYLHAADNTDPAQFAAMKEKFAKQGWMAVPNTLDNRPVLELRGFKKPKQLSNFLEMNGWAKGPATVTPLPEDKINRSDKWHNLTLKLSGVAYTLGDMGFLYRSTKGYLRERTWANRINIIASIGYALGSQVLIFFGSRDQSENQIRGASRHIHRFLLKEGVPLPQDAAIHKVVKDRDRSFWGNIDHFFGRYPSETMNTIYIFVGLLLAGAAFKNARVPRYSHELLPAFGARRTEAQIDIGLGLVTAASALGAIAVKEKKHVEGEPKRKGLAGIWDWVQEKPLRISGYGYMLATAFHSASFATAMKNGSPEVRREEMGRGVFIVTNVIAEFLMAISSKGHGEGIKADGVETTVLATAADLIASQKPEDQPAIIQRLAGYLSSPEQLGGKAEAIEAALKKQVAFMQGNPWRGAPDMPRAKAAIPALSASAVTPGIQVTSAKLSDAARLTPSPSAGLNA